MTLKARQFRLGERIRWAFIKAIAATTVGGFAVLWYVAHTMPRFF